MHTHVNQSHAKMCHVGTVLESVSCGVLCEGRLAVKHGSQSQTPRRIMRIS